LVPEFTPVNFLDPEADVAAHYYRVLPMDGLSVLKRMMLSNGVAMFDIIGEQGSRAVLQASTDCQSWAPVQTNVLGSTPARFIDTQAAAAPKRFYRVAVPQ
jgi:hypothetical protein